jgi:hypothetical protein
MSLLLLKDETAQPSSSYGPRGRSTGTFDGWLAAELLAGCLLFVVAKTFAAEHNVFLIDRFDIWAIGLVPALILVALSGVATQSALRIAAARVYVLTWLLTLLAFIVPQDLLVVQSVEDLLANLLAVTSRNPVDALLGFAYALAGVSLGWLLVGRSVRRLYLPSLKTIAALVLLNWGMLFVFVLWSRFAI